MLGSNVSGERLPLLNFVKFVATDLVRRSDDLQPYVEKLIEFLEASNSDTVRIRHH